MIDTDRTLLWAFEGATATGPPPLVGIDQEAGHHRTAGPGDGLRRAPTGHGCGLGLERRSAFVRSLELPSRLLLEPPGSVGALGAAALTDLRYQE